MSQKHKFQRIYTIWLKENVMDGYVMITLIQSDRPTQLPRGPNVSYVFLEFELQVPVRTD